MPERMDRGLRWLSEYGKFPTNIKGLDTPALIEVFAEWSRMGWERYIKSEFIPSKQFITENIKLIPAKELSMRGIVWLQLEGGGCLLVNKGFSDFPRPASEPKSDEWFDLLKQRAKDNAEKVKRKQDWQRSPKEADVQALLARLPDNDPDKKELWDKYVELNKQIEATTSNSEKKERDIQLLVLLMDRLEGCIRTFEEKQNPLPPGITKGAIKKWAEDHYKKWPWEIQ